MAGTLPIVAMSLGRLKEAVRRWKWPLVAAAGALGLAGIALLGWAVSGSGEAPTASGGETARALRDRLVVTVAESGEVEAKRSVDVRCEVEGNSTIVWLIEEGVTVQSGDKLIELDSAELQERLQTQEVTTKAAQSAFEMADKQYGIVQSTRESKLSEAALTVKFTLIDFRKYLGMDLADRLGAQGGQIAFEPLVEEKSLGGEALQEKRRLESEIDLAAEELSRAANKVEWTRKLKEKGYVTGSELQADELAFQRQEVALDQAKTALDLFLRYEFPKAAEKAYTDWIEAKREYDRVDARTQSEVDSARAELDTKRETHRLEQTRLDKVRDQLAKSTIRAPQAGMVVFELSGRDQTPVVSIGATVRHQQILIKLPDLSEMSVNVKLHESVVKQVSLGAVAYTTIDAFPKDRLTGKVTKIAVMPDRENWWMNPGLKAYETQITLDATPAGLKPGMSAQVEILVDARLDVLQVPVSAVFLDKGVQVVYIKTPGGPETRRVEVGLSNERAVEILKGLREGEDVYLYKPAGTEELKISEEEMAERQQLERRADAREDETPPAAPPPADAPPPDAPRAGASRADAPPPADAPRARASRAGASRADAPPPAAPPPAGSSP